MKKDYPSSVHCHIHNASTTIGPCDKDMPEHFVVGCYYCNWEQFVKLKEEFKKIKSQRDCLVEAMSIVNIEKITK